MTVRSRPRALLLVVALVAGVVLSGLGRPGPAEAATPSAAVGPAAAWLAALVGPDGVVENPYAPGEPSLVWTVNVALSLAAAGTEPDALRAAMAAIEADVEGYVAETGTEHPGRLGYLILLADATGRDPRAFGTPAGDLVTRLLATYANTEDGLFGAPDNYSSAATQSLAILGLVAAGEAVPADAVAWLVDQQCRAGEGPAGVTGGWQGYRAPVGDGRADCVIDTTSFVMPDSDNTGFAVQALAATGSLGLLEADALGFFRSLQADSGPAAGGFAFTPVDPTVVPNSTAVVIQALLVAGEDLAGWQAGDGDPLTSLESWVITAGPDAGALTSHFAEGFPDVFATSQGVWGLALQPFPFSSPQPIPPAPTTSTSTTTTPGTDDDPERRGTDTRRPTADTGRVATPRFAG